MKILSLFLVKHHIMKMYGGMEVYIHPFLTSALFAGACSASFPAQRAFGSQWIGGWMDLRAGLNSVKKRKISCSYIEPNSNTSDVRPISQPPHRLRQNKNYSGIPQESHFAYFSDDLQSLFSG
jgi:hypothetical protein